MLKLLKWIYYLGYDRGWGDAMDAVKKGGIIK